MKILKNLLGDGSKIHGDSIYFESGSNDDGSWVKLSNGWIICIHHYPPSSIRANLWNYPKAFAEPPVFLGVPNRNGDGMTYEMNFRHTGSNPLTQGVWEKNSSDNVGAFLTAIGR